jgi:hypothetical protein
LRGAGCWFVWAGRDAGAASCPAAGRASSVDIMFLCGGSCRDVCGDDVAGKSHSQKYVSCDSTRRLLCVSWLQVDPSDIVRSLFMKGIMLSMNQVCNVCRQ